MSKVLYIDEDEKTRLNFKLTIGDDIHETGSQFDVEVLDPPATLDECIEIIRSMRDLDALVSDFNLKELRKDVEYNGAELVDAFLTIRPGFPCFIVTNYARDAISMSTHPQIVSPRDILNYDEKDSDPNDQGSVSLQLLMESVIGSYKEKVRIWTEEFQLLVEKQETDDFTASDETRLVELDGYLEAVFDSTASRPSHLKSRDDLKIWNSLLEEANSLLRGK